MSSDTTETAFEAIEIMEQKNFTKSEIATLLKSLDDRHLQKVQQEMTAWKQDLVTKKTAYWFVAILAFLILTAPGALQKFLTSGALQIN